MTILDQSFDNSAGCFGMCSDDTGMVFNKHEFMNNHLSRHYHRQPSLMAQNGLTSTDHQQMTKEVDTMLSQAMNHLTFEERQEQQEVLHGVDTKVSEDTALIEAGLRELDDHLTNSKKGTVYELAETMDPDYVSSRALRLLFLRTDRYDAKDAAGRMIRFFEWKQKLFGKEKLTKEIALEDLDDDDIECMKTGALQLAGADLSGRQVFLDIPGLRKFKKIENELRAHFYMNMSVLKSEATQIRGCVWVVYSIGDAFQDHSGGEGYTESAEMEMIIPPYKASIHCALDNLHDYLAQSLTIKVGDVYTPACHFIFDILIFH